MRVVLAVFVLALGACAAPNPETPDEPTEPTRKATPDAKDFGADPMGVARRWAVDPPREAPEELRRRLESWEETIVVRLARESPDRYRAVLAESDSKGADAVVLVIERDGAGWSVVESARNDETYLWPRM